MESKFRAALGVLKLFGVKTQPLEDILDQFEGKSPLGTGGPVPSKTKEGAQPIVPNGPDWDGEPENWYLVDAQGKRLTQETFVGVSGFEEGLAVIERQKDKGYKNGYIDLEGKFPFEPIYEMAQIFSGGLGAVQLNGKWGFVDKTGKTVIPFLYDDALRFDEGEKGRAQVKKDGKWFLIDKSGVLLGECPPPPGAR